MARENSRRFRSLAMGMMIIFSALAVMNLVSINVRASGTEYFNWNGNLYNKTDDTFPHPGYDSAVINITDGNLIICDGVTLTFNDGVSLRMKNIDPGTSGYYGIKVNATATFKVNSSSRTTEIISNPDIPSITYTFLNSGTIDFLGATVERVYGNSSDKTNTGGIRNLPGSTCNLTNCNIMDGDTHGIYAEGNETVNVTLNIANCVITNTTSDVLDGNGIFINGNSNVLINNVTINNTQEDGIKLIDTVNVTIQGDTVISNSQADGIYLDDSTVIVDGAHIHDNGQRGIYLETSNSSYIANSTIAMNNGIGIMGDYGNNLTEIYNNTISGNYGGLCLVGTNISVTENNVSMNRYTGIILDGAYNTIANNNASNNNYGISISGSNSNITNNNVYSNSGFGIYMSASNNNIAFGNTISDNMYGFSIGLCNGCTIANNTASSNHRYGIYLYEADGNNITNNNASSNDRYGIYLYGADGNNITNNEASNNSYTEEYSESYGYGIYLDHSDGNAIDTNTVCSNHYHGIRYEYSSYNNITNNTILNNGIYGIINFSPSDGNFIAKNSIWNNDVGIRIGSNTTTIIGNTVSNNDAYGIMIVGACYNRLTDNTMVDNGLLLYGDSLLQWNTHVIDTTNTVNGNPVRYWKNQTSGTVTSGAGEVILANCTNVVVEDQDMSGGGCIIIGASNNNTISKNTASNSYDGISLYSSSNNTVVNNTASSNVFSGICLNTSSDNNISGNTLLYNYRGIELGHSNNNNITNNNASSNGYAGIMVAAFSESNIIANNTALNNHVHGGIFLTLADSNHIVNNTVNSNDNYGIEIATCNRCIINNNTASSNGYAGIIIESYGHHNITNNTASSNSYFGIAISSSVENTLANNTMVDDGIWLSGSWLSKWNRHTIDTTNTVNGNPVYYWKDKTGGTIPSGAGQVILANCTGVTIDYQNLSCGSCGIELGFSSDNFINFSIASFNKWNGVYILHSDNNTFFSDKVTNNHNGFYLVASNGNNFTGNAASSNSFVGITLSWDSNGYASNGNDFTDDDVSNNSIGVYIDSSNNNTLINATIINNNWGIYIIGASNNILAESNLLNNNYGTILRAQPINAMTSENNTIYLNNYINNTYGIWCEDSSSAILTNNITRSTSDGIHALSSNLTISNNTISENDGSGIWMNTCFGEITGNTVGINCGEITNETVYGPTLGDGEDPSTIYLDHGSILNCTLYVDINGTGWEWLDPETDYSLDNETGAIYIDWMGDCEEGWYFYAYYNYSGGNGQYGIFMNNEQNYSLSMNIEQNKISGNMDDGIQALGCNINIANNNISENSGSGLWIENCTGEIINNIVNETVYGPTLGDGNDPTTIYLDHGNIINCTLYVDLNGTEWVWLDPECDYTLDYDTGAIYIDWMDECEENWTFYAYYNYSDSGAFPVQNNHINENLNNGIEIFNCNVDLSGNTISENTGSGLWMENCTGDITNNTITGNHEAPSGGGPPGGMSGIDLINCDEVYVGYNNVSWNDVEIYLENSENVTVEWNEMLDENAATYGGPTPMGIYAISSQMVAANNTVWGTCYGINVEDADYETIILENNFYRINSTESSTGTEIGIRLTNASPVVGLNLFDGIKTGIRCNDNSSAYIHNNTIINCSQDGIYLEWSGATIAWNNITCCDGDGILCYDNSSAYIHNNTVTNCTNNGIYLEWSNATIIGNKILNNGGWGIISKYMAPENAGANGTGLLSDNPDLGDNEEGMATQLWELQILVYKNGTGGMANQYIMVNDTNNNTVWDGYTDGQGYATIMLAQYELIYLAGGWRNYTPHKVYTDNDGTPKYSEKIYLYENWFVTLWL